MKKKSMVYFSFFINFRIAIKEIIFFPAIVFFLLVSGCQTKTFQTSTPEASLFTLMNNTGVNFRNTIIDTEDVTLYDSDLIYAGAGVATGDINNDGLVDIFFAGNQVPSRLYLNLGDFKFKDITRESGIFDKGWNTGVVMADVNGDSFLDIYVCVTGFKQEKDKRNLLFINNGDLTFTERSAEYGIDDNGASQIGSFFDYDNDGDLDLFVVNQPDDITNTFELPFYLDPDLIDTMNCNQLYENIGNKFMNVTLASGIGYVNADGFQVSVADVNNDGFQDLYINNDLIQPDFLFINNGDKTFTESLNERLNLVPFFSMGSTFSDFNNDGLLDIVSTEMMPPSHLRRKNSMPHPDIEFYDYVIGKAFPSEQRSRNMLQIQNPDGTFSEVGELANISRTDWSWSALACDFNNDGFQDLFISNGVKRDVFDQSYLALAWDGEDPQLFKYEHNGKELITNMNVFLMPNYVFENNGDLTFKDRSTDWGLTQIVASQGASYADLNNDGYPDLIVSNTDSLAYIYKNNGKELYGNNYLKVKLSGEGRNTQGLGAKVKIYSDGQIQFQQMQNAQGWYSSSEPTLFFGLGKISSFDSLEVMWLSSKRQTLYDVSTNQTITLHEKDAIEKVAQDASDIPTLFTQIEGNISPPFIHREKDFIDFKRDKLIPKKISREGPGLAVGDVNNDGYEDFFVGGASGQPGALYLQQADGRFIEMSNQPWHEEPDYEDISPLFVDLNNDQFLDIYVSSGSNEFAEGSQWLADRIYMNNGGMNFEKPASSILPDLKYSKSVVISGDIDNDGDMDLFVGGRVRNQYYPSSPENYILINEDGILQDKTTTWSDELKNYGMITDALFVDINEDAKLDLVVCGEWLPITVFINSGDRLENATSKYGLDKTNGWWNSLLADDFNNDGLIDLVAGNYGLNSVLKASEKEPVVIYYNDFDDNGSFEPILCYYKFGILAPYADRDLFTRTLPSFHNKFLTYRAYGKSSVTDIFTKKQLSSSEQFFAYHFESTLFINEGGKFAIKQLPTEAQVAPIYGMVSADFDNDGFRDLFVCGNTYSSFYEEGPMAALRGLVLKGDGKGNFEILRSDKTGISINKDAKAAGFIYIKSLDAYQLLVTSSNDVLDIYEHSNLNFTDKQRILGSGYLFNYTPAVGSQLP